MTSYIPDLFVIGAMKGGTSTLFRNVLVNPAICRTRFKEVNFFLDEQSLAELEKKYRPQFAQPELVKCDVSPKYSQHHNHPDVASRIYAANPRARIIYIVRDPVERIVSHLHHNLLRDRFNASNAEKEVRANPDYVMVSKYFYQLSHYLKVFPREQVLVVALEELITNPDVFCQRLGRFLDIPSIEYKNKRFNVSERRYQIRFYDFVHNRIKARRLIKLYHYFWLAMNIQPKKPVLSSETIAYLRKELASDVDSLVRDFQIDRTLWKNFN
jgi:Sulfotransferase domain